MQKTITILLWCFSCCTVLSAGANERNTDSLLTVLRQNPDKQQSATALLAAGKTIAVKDPEAALPFFRLALDYFKTQQNQRGQLLAAAALTASYQSGGFPDSLLCYARQSMLLARQLKDTTASILARTALAQAYQYKAVYDSALIVYLEAEQLLNTQTADSLQLRVLNGLQSLYYERSEYEKGIRTGWKALALARKLQQPKALSETLIGLANNHARPNQLPERKQLLLEALQAAEQAADLPLQAKCEQNLANISLKEKDLKATRQHLSRALRWLQKVQDRTALVACMRGLALCELMDRNNAEALRIADSALVLARQAGSEKEEAALTRLLSVRAFAAGDTWEGLRLDLESEAVLEKLVNGILSQQTAQLEKKFETEKKQEEIGKLKAEEQLQWLRLRQQKITNYILLASLLLAIAGAYLLFRINRQRQFLQQQRISELETERELSATKAVLRGEEQERTRLARDLHDGLGAMLAGAKNTLHHMTENLILTPENAAVLDRGMELLNSSIHELRRVAHNLMPEALKTFGLDAAIRDLCGTLNTDKTLAITYQSYDLQQGEGIPDSISITIYRVIQELVHNALKHAAAQNIMVQLTREKDKLLLTVEDDGIGFDRSLLAGSSGIGWNNIRNRIEYVKGTLDLDTAPGKGTSINIEISL